VAGEQDGPRWQRFTIERLDEDGWTTWAIDAGLPTLDCGKNCGDGSRIVALADGTVWASVDQGGLLRFDGDAWEAVRPLGDEDRPVPALVGEPRGTLWVDVESESGRLARARSDGTGWTVPDAAQPGTDPTSVGDPVAVGPDGTLWTLGYTADRCPVISAIDAAGRRQVPLEGCTPVLSLSVGPDGLVWLVTGPVAGEDAAAGGTDLLVIDPAAAFAG
jgi:hypothetical protein